MASSYATILLFYFLQHTKQQHALMLYLVLGQRVLGLRHGNGDRLDLGGSDLLLDRGGIGGGHLGWSDDA